MMAARKPRSVANPLESAITTPSERILKECHSLYVDSENGKWPPARVRAGRRRGPSQGRGAGTVTQLRCYVTKGLSAGLGLKLLVNAEQ